MAALTIRNLDDNVKSKLRLRAAAHDRSMEEEARAILGAALIGGDAHEGLATEIRKLVAKYGPADDLVLPKDEPVEPMKFE